MIWLVFAIKVLSTVIFFVLIAGIFRLPVLWLRQRWRLRYEREHHINIHHKANFRAFYYLAVESLEPALRFSVMSRSLPLVDVFHPVTEDVKVAASNPLKTSGKPVKTASSATPATPSHSIQQQALDGTSNAIAKTGTIANLLGAFAASVPGPLGENARKAQEGVRQGQVSAAKAIQVPKQAQQRMSAMQSDAQKLSGNAPGAKQAPSISVSAAKQASSPTINSRDVDILADEIDDGDASADLPRHPFRGMYCVQTFELDPEQTLPLTLMISSVTGRSLVGSFPYTVHLQVVPVKQLQEKIPALHNQGIVHYAPVSVWPSFVLRLVSLLVFLLGLFLWLCSFVFIWFIW